MQVKILLKMSFKMMINSLVEIKIDPLPMWVKVLSCIAWRTSLSLTSLPSIYGAIRELLLGNAPCTKHTHVAVTFKETEESRMTAETRGYRSRLSLESRPFKMPVLMRRLGRLEKKR